MFRKINAYFFEDEQITVADGVWFYGFLVVAVLFFILCAGAILSSFPSS